jgi:hypothetical protein
MNQDKGSSHGLQLLAELNFGRSGSWGDGTSIHKSWMAQQQACLGQVVPNVPSSPKYHYLPLRGVMVTLSPSVPSVSTCRTTVCFCFFFFFFCFFFFSLTGGGPATPLGHWGGSATTRPASMVVAEPPQWPKGVATPYGWIGHPTVLLSLFFFFFLIFRFKN